MKSVFGKLGMLALLASPLLTASCSSEPQMKERRASKPSPQTDQEEADVQRQSEPNEDDSSVEIETPKSPEEILDQEFEQVVTQLTKAEELSADTVSQILIAAAVRNFYTNGTPPTGNPEAEMGRCIFVAKGPDAADLSVGVGGELEKGQGQVFTSSTATATATSCLDLAQTLNATDSYYVTFFSYQF